MSIFKAYPAKPWVPPSASMIKINQEYIYKPGFKNTSYGWTDDIKWLLSIVKVNGDFLLKKLTFLNNELASEELLTFEDIQEISNPNVIPIQDPRVKDNKIYEVFGKSIILKRENFACDILIKNCFVYIPVFDYPNSSTYLKFPVYHPPRNLLPFPELKFDIDCKWHLTLCHEVVGGFLRLLVNTEIVKINWNDEEGIQKATKALVTSSGYRALEIQAVMLRNQIK